MNRKPLFDKHKREVIYIYPGTPPPLIITETSDSKRLKVSAAPPGLTNSQQIIEQSISNIRNCISRTSAHPDRILYIAVEAVFTPLAPAPFGGRKSNPGYAEFDGSTAEELLAFIVSSAYKSYAAFCGSRAKFFVVEAVNGALDAHNDQGKDVLDNLMLRGMKKAGHIEWHGIPIVPPRLRHVEGEDSVFRQVSVLFTPEHLSKRAREKRLGFGLEREMGNKMKVNTI